MARASAEGLDTAGGLSDGLGLGSLPTDFSLPHLAQTAFPLLPAIPSYTAVGGPAVSGGGGGGGGGG